MTCVVSADKTFGIALDFVRKFGGPLEKRPMRCVFGVLVFASLEISITQLHESIFGVVSRQYYGTVSTRSTGLDNTVVLLCWLV